MEELLVKNKIKQIVSRINSIKQKLHDNYETKLHYIENQIKSINTAPVEKISNIKIILEDLNSLNSNIINFENSIYNPNKGIRIEEYIVDDTEFDYDAQTKMLDALREKEISDIKRKHAESERIIAENNREIAEKESLAAKLSKTVALNELATVKSTISTLETAKNQAILEKKTAENTLSDQINKFTIEKKSLEAAARSVIPASEKPIDKVTELRKINWYSSALYSGITPLIADKDIMSWKQNELKYLFEESYKVNNVVVKDRNIFIQNFPQNKLDLLDQTELYTYLFKNSNFTKCTTSSVDKTTNTVLTPLITINDIINKLNIINPKDYMYQRRYTPKTNLIEPPPKDKNVLKNEIGYLTKLIRDNSPNLEERFKMYNEVYNVYSDNDSKVSFCLSIDYDLKDSAMDINNVKTWNEQNVKFISLDYEWDSKDLERIMTDKPELIYYFTKEQLLSFKKNTLSSLFNNNPDWNFYGNPTTWFTLFSLNSHFLVPKMKINIMTYFLRNLLENINSLTALDNIILERLTQLNITYNTGTLLYEEVSNTIRNIQSNITLELDNLKKDIDNNIFKLTNYSSEQLSIYFSKDDIKELIVSKYGHVFDSTTWKSYVKSFSDIYSKEVSNTVSKIAISSDNTEWKSFLDKIDDLFLDEKKLYSLSNSSYYDYNQDNVTNYALFIGYSAFKVSMESVSYLPLHYLPNSSCGFIYTSIYCLNSATSNTKHIKKRDTLYKSIQEDYSFLSYQNIWKNLLFTQLKELLDTDTFPKTGLLATLTGDLPNFSFNTVFGVPHLFNSNPSYMMSVFYLHMTQLGIYSIDLVKITDADGKEVADTAKVHIEHPMFSNSNNPIDNRLYDIPKYEIKDADGTKIPENIDKAEFLKLMMPGTVTRVILSYYLIYLRNFDNSEIDESIIVYIPTIICKYIFKDKGETEKYGNSYLTRLIFIYNNTSNNDYKKEIVSTLFIIFKNFPTTLFSNADSSIIKTIMTIMKNEATLFSKYDIVSTNLDIIYSEVSGLREIQKREEAKRITEFITDAKQYNRSELKAGEISELKTGVIPMSLQTSKYLQIDIKVDCTKIKATGNQDAANDLTTKYGLTDLIKVPAEDKIGYDWKLPTCKFDDINNNDRTNVKSPYLSLNTIFIDNNITYSTDNISKYYRQIYNYSNIVSSNMGVLRQTYLREIKKLEDRVNLSVNSMTYNDIKRVSNCRLIFKTKSDWLLQLKKTSTSQTKDNDKLYVIPDIKELGGLQACGDDIYTYVPYCVDVSTDDGKNYNSYNFKEVIACGAAKCVIRYYDKVHNKYIIIGLFENLLTNRDAKVPENNLGIKYDNTYGTTIETHNSRELTGGLGDHKLTLSGVASGGGANDDFKDVVINSIIWINNDKYIIVDKGTVNHVDKTTNCVLYIFPPLKTDIRTGVPYIKQEEHQLKKINPSQLLLYKELLTKTKNTTDTDIDYEVLLSHFILDKNLSEYIIALSGFQFKVNRFGYNPGCFVMMETGLEDMQRFVYTNTIVDNSCFNYIDFIKLLYRLLHLIGTLYNEGIMYIDLKLENIMFFMDDKGILIKFIDLGSIIPTNLQLGELYKLIYIQNSKANAAAIGNISLVPNYHQINKQTQYKYTDILINYNTGNDKGKSFFEVRSYMEYRCSYMMNIIYFIMNMYIFYNLGISIEGNENRIISGEIKPERPLFFDIDTLLNYTHYYEYDLDGGKESITKDTDLLKLFREYINLLKNSNLYSTESFIKDINNIYTNILKYFSDTLDSKWVDKNKYLFPINSKITIFKFYTKVLRFSSKINSYVYTIGFLKQSEKDNISDNSVISEHLNPALIGFKIDATILKNIKDGSFLYFDSDFYKDYLKICASSTKTANQAQSNKISYLGKTNISYDLVKFKLYGIGSDITISEDNESEENAILKSIKTRQDDAASGLSSGKTEIIKDILAKKDKLILYKHISFIDNMFLYGITLFPLYNIYLQNLYINIENMLICIDNVKDHDKFSDISDSTTKTKYNDLKGYIDSFEDDKKMLSVNSSCINNDMLGLKAPHSNQCNNKYNNRYLNFNIDNTENFDLNALFGYNASLNIFKFIKHYVDTNQILLKNIIFYVSISKVKYFINRLHNDYKSLSIDEKLEILSIFDMVDNTNNPHRFFTFIVFADDDTTLESQYKLTKYKDLILQHDVLDTKYKAHKAHHPEYVRMLHFVVADYDSTTDKKHIIDGGVYPLMTKIIQNIKYDLSNTDPLIYIILIPIIVVLLIIIIMILIKRRKVSGKQQRYVSEISYSYTQDSTIDSNKWLNLETSYYP